MRNIQTFIKVAMVTCLLLQVPSRVLAFAAADVPETFATYGMWINAEHLTKKARDIQKLQKYKQDVLGTTCDLKDQVQKYVALKKAGMGVSNTLAGLPSLGLNYDEPKQYVTPSAMSEIRKMLVFPTDGRSMTNKEIQTLSENQALHMEREAVRGLSAAWLAQAEASAKNSSLSNFGTEIEEGKTHMSLVTTLVRISSEMGNDMNTRSQLTTDDVVSSSLALLNESKR